MVGLCSSIPSRQDMITPFQRGLQNRQPDTKTCRWCGQDIVWISGAGGFGAGVGKSNEYCCASRNLSSSGSIGSLSSSFMGVSFRLLLYATHVFAHVLRNDRSDVVREHVSCDIGVFLETRLMRGSEKLLCVNVVPRQMIHDP